MPPSHTIRLRDPWQTEPTARGRTRLRRRFGWTATLASGDRVLLLIGTATAEGRVWVNETVLGSFAPDCLPAQFDISRLLRPRNEAVIEIAGGKVGDVRLEIHAASSETVST
jgi:hypothetical protein